MTTPVSALTDPNALSLAEAIKTIPNVLAVNLLLPFDPELAEQSGDNCLAYSVTAAIEGQTAKQLIRFIQYATWNDPGMHQKVIQNFTSLVEAMLDIGVPAEEICRKNITAAANNFLESVLNGKRGSLNTEAIRIQNKYLNEGFLTPSEQADVIMLRNIQLWDYDVVDVRETAIANETPRDNIQWPPPPEGMMEFLKGY